MEQRKLKNQVPLLKEMEMLGNRKKYMQNIFLSYHKPKCTVFNMIQVLSSTFPSDMLVGRSDDVQYHLLLGLQVMRTMKGSSVTCWPGDKRC